MFYDTKMTEQPYITKDLAQDWVTVFPEITEKYFEKYWEAVEIMESQPNNAEQIFTLIIAACGNGHVDALLHLGFLYNETRRRILGNALIHKAHNVALQAFPKEFNPNKDKLYWSCHANRQILRTFQGVGLEYMYEGQYEKAIEKFNFILNVNPNDNQGVRYLLPECYIHLKKYKEFLVLDKKMDEADSLYYIFPKIVAFYKLDNIEQAKMTYKLAREKYPFVAEELLKKKHNFPHGEFDPPLYGDGAPTGSRQDAFNYWKETNQLWEKDRDLKKFLVENYA